MTDYSDFSGNRVDLTYTNGTENVAASGRVTHANSNGIQFQPTKGKSILVLNAEITGIVAVAEAEKVVKTPGVIKAKRVDLVTLGTVKQHLADRHGMTLSDVNSPSPEEALAIHEMHHSRHGDNSPHYHAEKPVKADPAEVANPAV